MSTVKGLRCRECGAESPVAPLHVCDPGPGRRALGALRDLPSGDLQAEQRRWQEKGGGAR